MKTTHVADCDPDHTAEIGAFGVGAVELPVIPDYLDAWN